MRRPYRVAFMYSSSTWFGLKSPEMPAKRYTSVSPTVLRTVTVFPMVRAAMAASGPAWVVMVSLSSRVPDVVHAAAVDGEHLGSDPSRLGRREERDGIGDVLGPADAPDHRPRRHGREVGLRPAGGGHVGEDEARRDRVHRHTMRPELEGEAARQNDHRGFG